MLEAQKYTKTNFFHGALLQTLLGELTAVTEQHADTPTRRLPICRLDDSCIGHLADWSTRGLNNSRLDKLQTDQLADPTGDFVRLVFVFSHLLMFSCVICLPVVVLYVHTA